MAYTETAAFLLSNLSSANTAELGLVSTLLRASLIVPPGGGHETGRRQVYYLWQQAFLARAKGGISKQELAAGSAGRTILAPECAGFYWQRIRIRADERGFSHVDREKSHIGRARLAKQILGTATSGVQGGTGISHYLGYAVKRLINGNTDDDFTARNKQSREGQK